MIQFYPTISGIDTIVGDYKKNYNLGAINSNDRFFTLSSIFHASMLHQLQEYLDNEILESTCYYQALVHLELPQRTLNYHAENCIIRLASYWEHLFQILNTYLEINMLPTKKLYQDEKENRKIAGRFSRKNSKVKTMKIEDSVKRYISNSSFLKAVKKTFIADSFLRPLVNLSNSPISQKVRELRNQIVHHKYISQQIVTTYADDSSQIFSINPNTCLNHNDLVTIVDKCLMQLYEGMRLVWTMYRQDMVPRKKGGKNEFVFWGITCQCNPNRKIGLPKEFKQFDESNPNSPFKLIFCPECFADNVSVTEDEYNVSEQTWNEFTSNYFEKIPAYIKRKLEHLASSSIP